jgi:hypothetical protein
LPLNVARVELIVDTGVLGVKTYTFGPKIVLFCPNTVLPNKKSVASTKRQKIRLARKPWLDRIFI